MAPDRHVPAAPEKARTVRYYRERLNAVAQYVYELYEPLGEGYHPEVPKQVGEGLREMAEWCVELDRAWAKSDRRRPAVGGEVELVAVSRG